MISADLIVHVRDIAHPDSDAQRADVEQVLREIGADAPRLEVWNKCDRLGEAERGLVEADAARRDDVVLLSALTGDGVDRLRRTMADRLTAANRIRQVALPVEDGATAAWLHEHGEVLSQHVRGGTVHYDVRLSDTDWGRFQARHA